MLRPVPAGAERVDHLDLVDRGELVALATDWEPPGAGIVYPAGTVFMKAANGTVVCLHDGEVWTADEVPSPFVIVTSGTMFEYRAP